MEYIANIIEAILHLDKHLGVITQNYGNWVYLFLFLIVFAETGLVITPFLPGDSLLFAVGALASRGVFDLWWIFAVLAGAAIIGDTANYSVGKYFGKKMLIVGHGRFFKKEHVDRTHLFYEKYGGKTIILARFIPIIRTFAPFVAGIGRMSYLKFVIYNITGALLWVAIFLLGGYFFGNVPIVKDNFSIVIFVIMALSVAPVAVEVWRQSRKEKNGRVTPAVVSGDGP